MCEYVDAHHLTSEVLDDSRRPDSSGFLFFFQSFYSFLHFSGLNAGQWVFQDPKMEVL